MAKTASVFPRKQLKMQDAAFTEKCFALRDRFPNLREWCPGHLWAPSCYLGWEVVEKYISGQKGKGYEKKDTVPMIDEEKEKLRAHKTWYNTLYNKLFGGQHQK